MQLFPLFQNIMTQLMFEFKMPIFITFILTIFYYLKTFLYNNNYHRFYIVNRNQLLFLIDILAMFLTITIAFYLHVFQNFIFTQWENFFLHISATWLTFISLCWCLMLGFESHKDFYIPMVQNTLQLDFWQFIISEIMLFVSFFWTYFHYLSNSYTSYFDAYYWTTVFLILFKLWISKSNKIYHCYSHTSSKKFGMNKIIYISILIYFFLTSILEYIFLIDQKLEYNYSFEYSCFTNSVWSVFYGLTWFLVGHVLIGLLFLQFNLVKMLLMHHWQKISSWIVFFFNNVNIIFQFKKDKLRRFYKILFKKIIQNEKISKKILQIIFAKIFETMKKCNKRQFQFYMNWPKIIVSATIINKLFTFDGLIFLIYVLPFLFFIPHIYYFYKFITVDKAQSEEEYYYFTNRFFFSFLIITILVFVQMIYAIFSLIPYIIHIFIYHISQLHWLMEQIIATLMSFLSWFLICLYVYYFYQICNPTSEEQKNFICNRIFLILVALFFVLIISFVNGVLYWGLNLLI